LSTLFVTRNKKIGQGLRNAYKTTSLSLHYNDTQHLLLRFLLQILHKNDDSRKVIKNVDEHWGNGGLRGSELLETEKIETNYLDTKHSSCDITSGRMDALFQ